MGQLRTKMEQDMLLRGINARTATHYVRSVTRLTRYYGRSPDTLTLSEIEEYLVYLRRERQVSVGTLAATITGLRFFYHVTLGRSHTDFFIPRPKPPHTQPHILSPHEVCRLLEQTQHRRDRALLATTYAAGLRVSEVVKLKVSDVDGERMLLRIEQGKGAKDRYTLLTERLLAELRAYWRVCRPPQWLFTGESPDHPMSTRTAERIYTRAAKRARIRKPGGIHLLRHAFATQLVERGADVPTLQCLLGHNHIETTARYLHLTPRSLGRRGVLCDLLDFESDA